jgi:ATP-dependent DNA helicase RecQ
MGIDKSNVRYVIHAGMPKSLEHYQQESGRAGRDGLEAECWLFHSGNDFQTWKRMLEKSEPQSREGALRSLGAMDDFCKSVVCRHRAIVRYFGQELDGDNCGACDVCLGELDQVTDAVILAQKILSCVARLSERFGADYTAKVLAGSQEQRIVQQGHDGLSTYGLLKEHPIQTIRAWIEQLVSQAFLAKQGEYNVLQLTATGRGLLKGQGTPKLLQPIKPRPPVAERSSRRAPADSWDGVDRNLFEVLRELRGKLAAELQVPAYIVFADTALRDMARRRPSTLDAFRHVNGVGDKKLADYGESFVATIVEYCRANNVPLDITPPPAACGLAPTQPPSDISMSALPAFEHFRRGAPIDEVMAKMNRARSTVLGYLGEYLRHEQIADPAPWVDAATARRIEAALEELGPQQRLTTIFEHLGGTIAYDQIRIVATCLSNRQ